MSLHSGSVYWPKNGPALCLSSNAYLWSSGLLNILLERRLLYTNCLLSITSVLKADLKYLAQYSYANCLTFESSLCKDSIFIKKKNTQRSDFVSCYNILFCYWKDHLCSEQFNACLCSAISFRFSLWSLWYPFKKQNILRIYWQTNKQPFHTVIDIYIWLPYLMIITFLMLVINLHNLITLNWEVASVM